MKNVKDMGEEGKVAVRNVRKDALKKVDKVRQGTIYYTQAPQPACSTCKDAC